MNVGPLAFVLVLVLMGAIVAGVATYRVAALNDIYQRLGRQFGGAVTPGSWTTSPELRFRHGETELMVDTWQDHHRRTPSTRIRLVWPDRQLRCQVYPHGWLSRLGRLIAVTDIVIGSRKFDSDYVIVGNDPSAIRGLLTPAVQMRIDAILRLEVSPALFGPDVHVAWSGGILTVQKQGQWRNHERLLRLIQLSLALFEEAFATRGLGIEFLGETAIGVVPGEAVCLVCGEKILSDPVLCLSCRTPHHRECWKYAEGCSVYGCGQAKFLSLPNVGGGSPSSPPGRR